MSVKQPIVAVVRKLVLIAAFCAGLAWALPAHADGAPPRLFGSIEFKAASLAALPQWVNVLHRIEKERASYAACDKEIRECAFPALAAWRAKIRAVKGLDKKTQLLEINRFINRWPYREDITNYGVADYWASPMEFLKLSGDCEDYTIIKYVTLRTLGYSADSLRIVVVQDTLRNVAHAVLAVYVDNDILIMDSLYEGVLPQSRINYYVPQYSINETTRWAHIMPQASVMNTVPGVVPNDPIRR
ncbi:MAG TPA: transglutaminase-like cysteine peptidase [Alphaproteobacteria bacterium]|nr:transglutaminase-like cysteine peptidase [Alphaproteobacteria bacterium]